MAEPAIPRRDLGRGARRRGFALECARLGGPCRRSQSISLAAGWNGRVAVSGHVGSATPDGGILQRDSDAARHSLRAAAKLGPFADTGLGCCRRLRKLCLRRRHRVCARRHCGGACPVRGNMPRRAVASRGRAGDRRVAHRLLYHAVRFRSADRVAHARRRESDRYCPLHRIWRAVSEVAAASRGRTRLLVDYPAGRIAGRLFRRARRVDGGAAKRLPAGPVRYGTFTATSDLNRGPFPSPARPTSRAKWRAGPTGRRSFPFRHTGHEVDI